MKSILKILVVALGVSMLTSIASGQTTVTTQVPTVPPPVTSSQVINDDFGPDDPTVPFEVITSGGMQAVGMHLLAQADHVIMSLKGRSVAGNLQQRYYNLEDLRSLGYVHEGSFTELTEAITRSPFQGVAVKTPGGWYDIQVEITCFNRANRVCILGNSWVNAGDGPEDTLRTWETQPNIWIPHYVGVIFNEYITAAKWLGSQGEDVNLNTWQSDDGRTKVTLEDKMFDDGIVVIATRSLITGDENVKAYTMSNGSVVSGKQFTAWLGKSFSSNFLPVRNLADIGKERQIMFYRNNNQTFGRFPVIELKNDTTFAGYVSFTVSIWGSERKYTPAKVVVKALSTSAPYVNGKEYPIDQSKITTLPAGLYQFRARFEGVKDWSLDYNSKG